MLSLNEYRIRQYLAAADQSFDMNCRLDNVLEALKLEISEELQKYKDSLLENAILTEDDLSDLSDDFVKIAIEGLSVHIGKVLTEAVEEAGTEKTFTPLERLVSRVVGNLDRSFNSLKYHIKDQLSKVDQDYELNARMYDVSPKQSTGPRHAFGDFPIDKEEREEGKTPGFLSKMGSSLKDKAKRFWPKKEKDSVIDDPYDDYRKAYYSHVGPYFEKPKPWYQKLFSKFGRGENINSQTENLLVEMGISLNNIVKTIEDTIDTYAKSIRQDIIGNFKHYYQKYNMIPKLTVHTPPEEEGPPSAEKPSVTPSSPPRVVTPEEPEELVRPAARSEESPVIEPVADIEEAPPHTAPIVRGRKRKGKNISREESPTSPIPVASTPVKTVKELKRQAQRVWDKIKDDPEIPEDMKQEFHGNPTDFVRKLKKDNKDVKLSSWRTVVEAMKKKLGEVESSPPSPLPTSPDVGTKARRRKKKNEEGQSKFDDIFNSLPD